MNDNPFNGIIIQKILLNRVVMMKIKLRIAVIFLILMAVMFAACGSDDDNNTHKYTVTYQGNGNTGGDPPEDPKKYESTFSVTVLDKEDLVKDGYIFAGWNTQADGNGTDRSPGSTFIMGKADVVLYAKWTVNPTYHVTYDANGGIGAVPADNNNYLAGTTVTVLNKGSLAKDDYTFASWNTQADGHGITRFPASTFTMGSANVLLYAQWIKDATADLYAVTYNANGGTGTVPTDCNRYGCGDQVTVKANSNLTRIGYNFAGWNTKTDGSGTDRAPLSTFTMSPADLILYAKWTAIPTYTVTYNANGGTGSVPVDGNNYQTGATVTVLGAGSLTNAGYIFTGWRDGNGTYRASSSTFIMGSANVSLYAEWRRTVCGDALREGTEQCDDGNLSNTDACLNSCVNAECGDSYVWSGHEECDDNNSIDTDACRNNCTLTFCGDGIVNNLEECDDDNLVDTDACRNNCTLAFCGDGIANNGEICDDGNFTDGDGCDNNCTLTACGNGIVSGSEICDDGNFTNGDGCDNNCTVTACGNGIQSGLEQCDDGDTENGDGCSATCQVEQP